MNREEKKALTRRQIIDVATRLFRQHGIHNTDLKTIATEAGVSVVTFYKYFDSKDALIGTIAAEQLNTLFDQIMAITNQTDLRFIEKIKAFAQLSQQKQQEIANTFGDEMMQLLEKDDSAVRAVAAMNFSKQSSSKAVTKVSLPPTLAQPLFACTLICLWLTQMFKLVWLQTVI